MNIVMAVKLGQKYAKCPRCGKGFKDAGCKMDVENDIFRLTCKCGFAIAIDENGKKVGTQDV